MTANFQALMSKSPNCAAEFSKTGKLVNSDDEFPAHLRKKSQRTKGQEQITLRYESRKNMCPTCFTALSLVGDCGNCD